MRDPDDYKLSDIYENTIFSDSDEMLEEALISRAPKQQGFLGEVGTRIFNRLGNETANIKIQIMDEYHTIWSEFIRDWKNNKRLRKGTGESSNGYPVSYIVNFLKHIGIKDSNKVATKLGYSADKLLDRNAAGNLIFKSIQKYNYESRISKPTTTYRIKPITRSKNSKKSPVRSDEEAE